MTVETVEFLTCDRCGRCVENDNEDPQWGALRAVCGAINTGEMDICDACWEAFNAWLLNSKPSPTPGRAKGGAARAAKLTPERRKEIAKQGGQARWNGKT